MGKYHCLEWDQPLVTSAGWPGEKLQQVEEKVHFYILDELQRSDCKCRRTSEEEVGVVKAQDDKNRTPPGGGTDISSWCSVMSDGLPCEEEHTRLVWLSQQGITLYWRQNDQIEWLNVFKSSLCAWVAPSGLVGDCNQLNTPRLGRQCLVCPFWPSVEIRNGPVAIKASF